MSWASPKSCPHPSVAARAGVPADKQLWGGHRNYHALLQTLDIAVTAHPVDAEHV